LQLQYENCLPGSVTKGILKINSGQFADGNNSLNRLSSFEKPQSKPDFMVSRCLMDNVSKPLPVGLISGKNDETS